jgi:hypothetical protein
MAMHQGGCHCGRIRYEAEADLTKAIECNCSFCSKAGGVLAFVPASTFRLESGEDALWDYQFGKKAIHHLFCSDCGIRAFSRGAMPDGTPMVALNLRCVDGIDLSTVTITHYDGAHA